MKVLHCISAFVILLAIIHFGNNSYSFELIEPPPDSLYLPLGSVESESHLYGSEEGEFDVGQAFPEFDNVFNLYVTNHIAQWDSIKIASLILKIMDSDSTNADDYFPLIWDYFCYGDSIPSYAAVKYRIGYTIYTDINVYLYSQYDFDCPDNDQATSFL